MIEQITEGWGELIEAIKGAKRSMEALGQVADTLVMSPRATAMWMVGYRVPCPRRKRRKWRKNRVRNWLRRHGYNPAEV